MASDVSAIERKSPSPDSPSRDDAPSSQADAQLRAEIRLLGRILGDTVRDQEGDDVFDLVESIRQASIRFHRDEDEGARHELSQDQVQETQRQAQKERAYERVDFSGSNRSST